MEWGNLWLLAGIAAISFLLSFIGAAVGLILGHMRLPLLIAYLKSASTGAACNLIISGVGALAGTVRHLRDGRVSWHCLALMGLPSAAGAAGAAYVFTKHVNHFWAYLIIGLMLVVSGWVLVRQPAASETPPEAPGPWQIAIEIVIGLGLGALAAITGLMLGSLRLPMMLRFLKIDPRVAVGSNMAIGCLTALVAAATYFTSAHEINWPALAAVMLVVVPPTVLGSYFGAWLTGHIRKETVRRLAGWIIAITGVLMIGQEVGPRLGPLLYKGRAALPEATEEADPEDADADDD
jgi:uncharacterized membrane protein YfcA